MAKVVAKEVRVIAQPEWHAWLKMIGYGAAVGFLVYLVGIILGRYVVEPFMCRNVVDLATCVDPSLLAGRISAVLVAVGAIFGLVKLMVARPLVIAVASVVVLWDMSAWTAGLFWLEALAWSMTLYVLAYVLFAWIARHAHIVVSLVTAVVIAVAIRIALALT